MALDLVSCTQPNTCWPFVCRAASLLQLYPTVQQATAMRALVSSLRLAPAASAAAGLGPEQQQGEQQAPECCLNPSIQRFYWFMGQRALDPQHQVGWALRGGG